MIKEIKRALVEVSSFNNGHDKNNYLPVVINGLYGNEKRNFVWPLNNGVFYNVQGEFTFGRFSAVEHFWTWNARKFVISGDVTFVIKNPTSVLKIKVESIIIPAAAFDSEQLKELKDHLLYKDLLVKQERLYNEAKRKIIQKVVDETVLLKVSDINAEHTSRMFYNINHDEFYYYIHNLERFFLVGQRKSHAKSSFPEDMYFALVPSINAKKEELS